MEAKWEIRKSVRFAYARNGNVGNATQYASWWVFLNGRFQMRFPTRREATAYVVNKGGTPTYVVAPKAD